jgi:hypothetical protein
MLVATAALFAMRVGASLSTRARMASSSFTATLKGVMFGAYYARAAPRRAFAYTVDQFEVVFRRYLPKEGALPVTP